MSNNVKFDRRVNIRTRNSDRVILCYAIAAAVAAHAVFLLIFNYRRPAPTGDESGSKVTMLALSDFPKKERVWIRRWLDYNDPRNFDRGEFDEKLIGGALQNALKEPPDIKSRSDAEIPVRSVEVGKFREVRGGKLSSPTLLPLPPRDEPKPAVVSGAVTDGKGRTLPLGGLKLPARTPAATGRTVLRVFRSGAEPVLLLERSCGDAKLDDFAIHSLRTLVGRGSAPEFIVVEWPEARK